MEAKILDGYLTIKSHEVMGSLGIIKICFKSRDKKDWDDEYWTAPAAIEFNGRIYGKSSYNTDYGDICYRTDRALARIV